MIAQAECLKAEVEYSRAHSDKTGAFLNWMFDDIWPTVDYYLEPKESYYQLRRSFEPYLGSFYEDKNGKTHFFFDVQAKEEYSSMIEVSVKTFDGKEVFNKSYEFQASDANPFDVELNVENTKDCYFVATYVLSPRALGNSDGLEWVYIEKDGGAGWTPILLDIYRGDEADYPYASKTLERTDLSYNNYLEIMSEQSADDADTTETPDTDTEVPDTETKEPEPKDVLPPEPDTNEDETKSDGFFSSPTTIFVFCIVSAVVLALVAAVLLMIIKKKK